MVKFAARTRRDILGALATVGATSLLPALPSAADDGSAIIPFQITIPDEQIAHQHGEAAIAGKLVPRITVR